MLKKKNFRNSQYLEFIRSQLSAISDDSDDYKDEVADPVVAHQVRIGQNGRTGLEPSDYRTIPLSDSQHKKLHDGGEKSFYEFHGLNEKMQMVDYLFEYIYTKMSKNRNLDFQSMIPHLEELIEVIDRNVL